MAFSVAAAFVVLLVVGHVALSEACRTVHLQSTTAKLDYHLTQVPLDEQSLSNELIEFVDTGRPLYRYVANRGFETEEIFYLFHEKTSDSTGTARWVLSSYKPNHRRAFRKFHLSFLALVDSWAVLPQLVAEVADSRAPRSVWQVKNPDNQRWTTDKDLRVTCASPKASNEGAEDPVIFFESSVQHQHRLSGFFVRRFLSDAYLAEHPATSVAYSKVKIYPEDPAYALFDINFGPGPDGQVIRHWLISDDGVGVESGIAYAEDPHRHADLIPDSTAWRFIGRLPNSEQTGWVEDPTARVISIRKYNAWIAQQQEDEEDEEVRSARAWRAFKHTEEDEDDDNVGEAERRALAADLGGGTSISLSGSTGAATTTAEVSIFRVLRDMRRMTPHPNNALQQILPNGVGLPRIGLGTGGISLEDSERVFIDAMEMGYQFFDLAREYGNEHILGHIANYNRYHQPEEWRRFRQQLFYETKVWPTYLGFGPTIHEVLVSLGDLRTHYIDLYLLHWPSCDTSIDWMHCHDTMDPQGTWQQSWKALEKMYAEGYLQAIGVSNFDVTLLQQLKDKVGTILPHVVQNYASMDHPDTEVRLWCSVHGTAYQPYATIRNVRHLHADDRRVLQSIVRRVTDTDEAGAAARAADVNEHAVLLRYFLQTGACIIPRATQVSHLQANLQLWSWGLTETEVASLGWDENRFHEMHQQASPTTSNDNDDDL
jgi:diketogulonate reductase-like aldo/keto reductase